MSERRYKRLMAAGTFLLFLLIACTKKPSAESVQPEAAPTATPAPSEVADTDQDKTSFLNEKWTGDLDGMIERRRIRVLTAYSKTDYFVDKGTQRGLTYEAFQLFDDELNRKLKTKKLRVDVVFVPVAHDDLIPALLDGRGDVVAAGKLITERRLEQVDFTNPTRSNVASIVVTGPGSMPLTSVEELGGKEIYLRMSEIGPKSVERFNQMLAKAGKPPVKILPAPEVLADEDILEMVNAGIVNATVTNDYTAEFWQQIFPNIVLSKAAAVRTDGQIAMMVRKGSPKLKAELNEFLARHPEGSKERNILLQKYLKNTSFAKQATSQKEREKFQRVVEFFRKYSSQYSVDYLLMAAQGYQESGLDQNVKSPVGAIGVMQVMPGTGKDMKVGDIAQIEPNVHAGVKYIRFMMDQYYANEPMDNLNKGLFTFASYNAGPARIRQMREMTAKRGLNPNLWFNNVELVVSEKIGRETVQYVSNIYKYYLAYKMLADQAEQRQKAKSQIAGER